MALKCWWAPKLRASRGGQARHCSAKTDFPEARTDNLGVNCPVWYVLALKTYRIVTDIERRHLADRRRAPRGGRRGTDPPGRHPQILIADSYDGARIPCAKYLDRLGFGVLEAGDGQQALAHIDARLPDVIVIENGLPDAPVAQVARRLYGSQAVPLIVTTSDLDAVDETLTGLPHVAVLEKPFSMAMMVEEIRRLLRAQPLPMAEPV